MRKIYIAFLGIAPYLNCNYVYNDTKVDNVKYIQEAMIKLLCKDFSESDKYIFFLTKDAEKENWNDKSENKGLANTLNEFIPKDNIIKISDFPEGKNENEIWKMFELIYEQINDNDEILVDITHSFRYIPMLMLLILNYAKYMKNITVRGIFYGALEVLGPSYKIKEMPVPERNVPIFDITPFSDLQDWTIAAENFTKYGNPDKISEIIKKKLKNPITREFFIEESQFMRYIKFITTNISMSNLKNIKESRYMDEITEWYNVLKKDKNTPKPFQFISKKIYNKINEFKPDSIYNGFIAVKWCIEHGLIQQGYTILQETIISIILFDLGKDYLDRNYRDKVSHAIQIYIKAYNETLSQNYRIEKALSLIDKEIEDTEEKEIYKEIYTHSIFNRENSLDICNKYIDLTNFRNYLNHAGIRENSIKPNSIENKLPFFLDFFQKILETTL